MTFILARRHFLWNPTCGLVCMRKACYDVCMRTPPFSLKCVLVSKQILLSQNLSPREKLFLVAFNALDNGSGSFATNAFFAALFGCSSRQVQTIIANLKSKRFIRVHIRNGSRRLIRVAKKWRYQCSAPSQAITPL